MKPSAAVSAARPAWGASSPTICKASCSDHSSDDARRDIYYMNRVYVLWLFVLPKIAHRNILHMRCIVGRCAASRCFSEVARHAGVLAICAVAWLRLPFNLLREMLRILHSKEYLETGVVVRDHGNGGTRALTSSTRVLSHAQ